jgi:cell wall-associated NlpC family hydrolase
MAAVSSPQPGDLVFFTGSPVDVPPGHVGIVVDPARHLMIDAYESGVPVREETYGLPSSAPGLTAPWGFREAA